MRVGYILGSLFAHVTLAAAWMAFGPGHLIWRGPLSFVWVMMLPVCIAINVALHGGPRDAALTVGGCLLGQWLLLQFPFWGLAVGCRLGLQHMNAVEQASERGPLRFGVLHSLTIMLIVGIVLGIGRILMPLISLSGHQEGSIFAFLAVAAIAVTLPLLLAALMRRMAIMCVLLSLVLIAVVTAFELPLMEQLGGSGPEMAHFIAINVTSALVILVIAGVVRLNGYCLYGRPVPES